MKVDSNISYSQHYKLKHGSIYDHKSNMLVGLCDGEKNVNRGYCGSFTGKEKAAASFSLRLLDSVNKLCKEHKSIAQNMVALILAALFRPIAIISLPGDKNKDDKIYASGHSIASGLIGFGVSSIIMSPLDAASKAWMKKAEMVKERLLDADAKITEAIKKGVEAPKRLTKQEALKGAEVLGEKFLDIFGEFDKDGNLIKINRRALEKATSFLEMAIDTFGLGIMKACLTIALIPPILKYVFGVEKSKTPKPEPQNIMATMINRPQMAKFLGGEK